MKKFITFYLCLFFLCHNSNAWRYFSASYIFKLLLGAALVQSNSKTENNISSYGCYIYSYLRPSDNTTELPAVRAICVFVPAHKPAKKSNQERLMLNLAVDTYNMKASAHFLSKLKSNNLSKKNITRDDLSEMFDGFTPALTLSEDWHHFYKSEENCTELMRRRDFKCNITNVVKPKKKYPEDGDIYDLKCEAEKVDKQKSHGRKSWFRINKKDSRAKEFLKKDCSFRGAHLAPAVREADLYFLKKICKASRT